MGFVTGDPVGFELHPKTNEASKTAEIICSMIPFTMTKIFKYRGRQRIAILELLPNQGRVTVNVALTPISQDL